MSNLTVTVREQQENQVRAIDEVPFGEGWIEATRQDGEVWVSLRKCCESLGLSFPTQSLKLKSKPWGRVSFIETPDCNGRPQPTSMIHVDSLPMWLATIEPSRVDARLRERLVRWQIEAAKVLRDYYFGRREAAVAEQPLPPLLTVVEYTRRHGIVREAEDLITDWFESHVIAKKRGIAVEFDARHDRNRLPVELFDYHFGRSASLPQPQRRPILCEAANAYPLSLAQYLKELGVDPPLGERIRLGYAISWFARQRGDDVQPRQKGQPTLWPRPTLNDYFARFPIVGE